MLFTQTFFFIFSIFGTILDALTIPVVTALPFGVDEWLVMVMGWVNALPEILPPLEAIITGGKWFIDGILAYYLLVVFRVLK